MKLALVLLVILPVAFCAPEKRLLLENLGIDTAHIKELVQQIYGQLGADATEQACESECHKLVHDTLLDFGCDLVCKTFQQYAQKLKPATSAPTGPVTF